jgi:hypothetical protein
MGKKDKPVPDTLFKKMHPTTQLPISAIEDIHRRHCHCKRSKFNSFKDFLTLLFISLHLNTVFKVIFPFDSINQTYLN